ncbi:MAG: hypothetical protein AAB361_01785 [Patescibacteria group bacterium]
MQPQVGGPIGYISADTIEEVANKTGMIIDGRPLLPINSAWLKKNAASRTYSCFPIPEISTTDLPE